MKLPGHTPLWSFAFGDLVRHPGSAVLTGVTLGLISWFLGGTLFLMEGNSRGLRIRLEGEPALTVQRLGPLGNIPISIFETKNVLLGIRGITGIAPRIRGVAGAQGRPVTILGLDRHLDNTLKTYGISLSLKPGEAAVGSGHDGVLTTLRLRGAAGKETWTFHIAKVLASGIWLDEGNRPVVILRPGEAQKLLGLSLDQASELAVQVHQEREVETLKPLIEKALPWPAAVVTRDYVRFLETSKLGKRATGSIVRATPALLGLIVLMIAASLGPMGAKREMGILKTLGWTSRDLLRLHLVRGICLGVPFVVFGLFLAYVGVIGGISESWLGILFESDAHHGISQLGLDAVLRVMATVLAIVFLPWMAASLKPALQGARIGPGRLIDEAKE